MTCRPTQSRKASPYRIERTEYFQPKSEDSAAEVDVAPQLVDLLPVFKAEAKSEFVIESPNPPRYHTSRTNYRGEREFEALYAWLAGKGLSARKKLHELRKECGAVIANSMGFLPLREPCGTPTSASPLSITRIKR